jgi:hypothetical protein
MGIIRVPGGPDIHVPTNPSALARRVPSFAEMRARLEARSGHDLAVIDTFLDGRMTRVVQHIGDVYLAQIQGHIDTIERLRDNVSRGIEAVVLGQGQGRLEGMSIADLQRSFAEMNAVLHDLYSTAGYIRELSDQRMRELYVGSSRPRQAAPDPITSVAPTPIPPGTPPIQPASLTDPKILAQAGQKAQRPPILNPDGSLTVPFLREDVVLRIDSDGLLAATEINRSSGTVTASYREFDVVPRHRPRPRSGSAIQSHHGCQDALMLQFFWKYGYRSGAPPTIWMRDSLPGSPHRTVSDIQDADLANRKTLPPDDPENPPPGRYEQIRNWCIGDLRAAGAPPAAIRRYLAYMDKYFEKNIWPKIEEANRRRLVGTYESLSGEAP